MIKQLPQLPTLYTDFFQFEKNWHISSHVYDSDLCSTADDSVAAADSFAAADRNRISNFAKPVSRKAFFNKVELLLKIFSSPLALVVILMMGYLSFIEYFHTNIEMGTEPAMFSYEMNLFRQIFCARISKGLCGLHYSCGDSLVQIQKHFELFVFIFTKE